MEKDTRSRELVRSIIGLGQNMGLNIIAEGVETPDEAALLRDMGCEAAQGYHFAKPLPESQVIDLLKGWQPVKISA